MSLLHKVTLLLGCYDSKIQLQQKKLLLLEREERHIGQTLDTLNVERQGMEGLLRNMYPQGEMLNRAALYNLQRKQSVVRRRIANIQLEAGQQQQALSRCEDQKSLAQDRQKKFIRQVDKYTSLQRQERRNRYAELVQQEEAEIEEMIAWRK